MKKKLASLSFLVLGDLAALAFCFFTAYHFRVGVLSPLFPALEPRPVFLWPFFGRFYITAIWLAFFAYEKLYTKRHSFWDEARLLVRSSSMAFGFVIIVVFLTKSFFEFSRLVLFLSWLESLIVLPLMRLLVKKLIIRTGLWKKRVLIIGSRNGTAAVISAVRNSPMMGYEIVGCLTDDRESVGQMAGGIPILGHIDEIESVKKSHPFEDIIVTFPDIPRDRLVALLRHWDGVSETIRYIPRTGDLITSGVELETISGVLSLVVRKNLHKPWNVLIKTSFEFVLALVLLLLSSPILLLLAILIRADSKGPILFRQDRLGRRGKLIKVIKFRTMYLDNEARLERHLRENPEVKDEWETYRKLKHGDPRVTRIGRFMRRFSLDEIPQIANVIRGEMAIVGPRPYLPDEIAHIGPIPALIFEVRPGITGLWQVSGRSELPFEERLKLDERYIRNWSLWTDVVILFKTIRVWLSGQGAY